MINFLEKFGSNIIVVMLVIKYINPINGNKEDYVIDDWNIDYATFKTIRDFKTDKDICMILNSIYKDIDCTREIKGQRVCMTTYPIYTMKLQQYIWYLSHLQNQFLYNKYYNLITEVHQININFENDNPYIPLVSKKSRKQKVPNKFFKTTTYDMFTGNVIYEYENPKTGERITSEDGDLLDKLNASKCKKVKQSVSKDKKYVPMKLMTYKFK